nr:transposase [Eubacterium barkeri]
MSKVVHQLNNPSRRQLYTWIALEGKQKPKRKQLLTIHPPEHPRNPSFEVKIAAIKRYFEIGESVKSVSEDIGYNRATIYNWRKKYLKEGHWGLMNQKNIKRGPLKEGTVNHRRDELSASVEELATIKAQMHDMQMEIDLLTETINILKKDPGIDQRALSNREKTVIIDGLSTLNCTIRLSTVYYIQLVSSSPMIRGYGYGCTNEYNQITHVPIHQNHQIFD